MSVGSLRRVLLLGSGYTSAPLVEWLTRDGTVSVTIGESESSKSHVLYIHSCWGSPFLASNIPEQAEKVAAPFKNARTAEVDVTSDASLSNLIPGHHLVIR